MEQPELPDLKKKEKERKKAGAAWSWGNKGAGFEGATGGTVAARSAASAVLDGVAARAPQSLLQRLLGQGFLARLFAPFMGSFAGQLGVWAILGGGALLMASAGLYAAALALGLNAAPKGGAAPELGALPSMTRTHGPASAGLDWLARAAKGELKFTNDKPPPASEKSATDKAGEKQEVPKTDWNGVIDQERPNSDRLAHNLSGAKLSSSLGSAFGGKNVFANSNAPKFGAIGGQLGIRNGQLQGKAKSMKNGARSTARSGGRANRLVSKRAIGQLGMARTLSGAALGGPTMESARTSAADAFDGQVSPNSTPPSSPFDANPPPNGGGTGGGGGGGGGSTPSIPGPTTAPPVYTAPTAPGTNVTPYQPQIDLAKQLAEMAGKMKKQGQMLILLGIMIMALGFIWPPAFAIGAMLIGMGLMMLYMASEMNKKAKELAAQIAAAQAQAAQQAALQQCIDEAYANGGDTSACYGPDTNPLNLHNQIPPEESENLGAPPEGFHWYKTNNAQQPYALYPNEGEPDLEHPPAGYHWVTTGNDKDPYYLLADPPPASTCGMGGNCE